MVVEVNPNNPPGHKQLSADKQAILNGQKVSSIKKGIERVRRVLNVISDDDSTSSSSSSSSLSESESSESSDSEPRRKRSKKKRGKKYRKYRLKKRKYKRARSRSRNLRKKRKVTVGDLESRPEFQEALDRRLRELGYGEGSADDPQERRGRSRSRTPAGKLPSQPIIKSPSVDTIYVPAVARADQSIINKVPSAQITEKQVAEQLNKLRLQFAGTSGGDRRNVEVTQDQEHYPESADRAIIQAGKFKAKINNPNGEFNCCNLVDSAPGVVRDDDEFIHISSDVDLSIKDRIRRGEFVELEKLLKRNKTLGMDITDQQMTLDVVTREGHTYLTPKQDKVHQIGSLRKWEQAFRVYATIYS